MVPTKELCFQGQPFSLYLWQNCSLKFYFHKNGLLHTTAWVGPRCLPLKSTYWACVVSHEPRTERWGRTSHSPWGSQGPVVKHQMWILSCWWGFNQSQPARVHIRHLGHHSFHHHSFFWRPLVHKAFRKCDETRLGGGGKSMSIT
jgi:hypothetical protein